MCMTSERGTRKCSCLRSYATSRKIAASSPVTSLIIFFPRLSNPSSRITVMVFAQPLRERVPENLSRGKERPVCKADNLTTICEPIV
jgi:hypothetical protein